MLIHMHTDMYAHILSHTHKHTSAYVFVSFTIIKINVDYAKTPALFYT